MMSLMHAEKLAEMSVRKQQPLCSGVPVSEVLRRQARPTDVGAGQSARFVSSSLSGGNASRLAPVMCGVQAPSLTYEAVEGSCAAEDVTKEYTLKEILGAGQQGIVKRAIHNITGEEVAIKVVSKDGAANPLALKRLRAEAQMMAGLQHSAYAPRLENTFEDDDNVYIVMELLRGGSLQEKIEAGHIDEHGARQLMHGVLSFLKACHEDGIVFGDVKPANFMLTGQQDPMIKAVDFGCSQKLVPGLHLRARVGSPVFMAPEVHLGAYGIEADMWSAGVLLYQLLSGKLPFVRMEDGEIVELSMHLGFSFDGDEWSNVSQEAKDLVSALLVRNRGKRLSASKALASPWFNFIPGPSSSVVEFSRRKSGEHSLSAAN